MRLMGTRDGLPLGSDVWGNTHIELPKRIAGKAFQNTMTRRSVDVQTGDDDLRSISAATLFASFPVALLVSDNPAPEA